MIKLTLNDEQLKTLEPLFEEVRQSMLDMELSNTGKLIMGDGHISLEGFEVEGATCREVAVLSLLWAIGILQNELTEIVARPGGTGNCSVD